MEIGPDRTYIIRQRCKQPSPLVKAEEYISNFQEMGFIFNWSIKKKKNNGSVRRGCHVPQRVFRENMPFSVPSQPSQMLNKKTPTILKKENERGNKNPSSSSSSSQNFFATSPLFSQHNKNPNFQKSHEFI